MKYTSLLLLTIILYSCQDPDAHKIVIGEWKCTEWIPAGGKNMCDNNVYFHFKQDKTYTSKLGSAREQGTYSVSGKKLSVIAEDKMEILVEITEVTDSTLNLLMNSGGSPEKLSLSRIN